MAGGGECTFVHFIRFSLQNHECQQPGVARMWANRIFHVLKFYSWAPENCHPYRKTISSKRSPCELCASYAWIAWIWTRVRWKNGSGFFYLHIIVIFSFHTQSLHISEIQCDVFLAVQFPFSTLLGVIHNDKIKPSVMCVCVYALCSLTAIHHLFWKIWDVILSVVCKNCPLINGVHGRQ